jgi:two-component system sensor histidine kinase DesK
MNEHPKQWIGSAFALAWLVMLIPPIVIIGTGSQGKVAHAEAVVAALLVFAAVYVWYWLRVRNRDNNLLGTAVAVGGMLAIELTLVLVFLGDPAAVQGLSYNLIYVVVAAAFGLRWKAGIVACVLLAALALGINLVVSHGDFSAAFGVTVLVLLIGLGMVSVRQMVTTLRELARAREEMARLAVGEERLRFARDLHDLLGQSLSVIVLKSEVARGLMERDPEQATAAVEDIERVARGALRDVRAAVAGYRETNLAVELAGAREMLESAGISVCWEENAGSLSPEAESVLAWAVREGATNVLRHSQAREWMIKLERQNGHAVLEMLDDGRGETASKDGATLGNGLRGLRERVAAVGGEMDARQMNGRGFRLAVWVPVTGSTEAPSPTLT